MAGQRYIEQLSQLIDLLREKRVPRYSGPVELPDGTFMNVEILVAPPEARGTGKKKSPDPLKSRREHYELQLGRPVSDAELDMLP